MKISILAFLAVAALCVGIPVAAGQAKSYRYRITQSNGAALSECDTPDGAGRVIGHLLRDGHYKLTVVRETAREPEKPKDDGACCKCRCRGDKQGKADDLDFLRGSSISEQEWREHGNDPSYFGITGSG